MITLSPLRWGKPYESLDAIHVVHFDTGEPMAKIGTVGGGIVTRDMRQADKAREALRQIPVPELLEMCKKAAELFKTASLPVGDSMQSVDDFVHQQSASTGCPNTCVAATWTRTRLCFPTWAISLTVSHEDLIFRS